MTQQLMLANDLFPPLFAGTKRCTVRSGNRPISPGKLVFVSVAPGEDGQEILHSVVVNEVRHKKLADLTDTEAKMDGASSAAELKEALKRFYPAIKDDSDITIIIF